MKKDWSGQKGMLTVQTVAKWVTKQHVFFCSYVFGMAKNIALHAYATLAIHAVTG